MSRQELGLVVVLSLNQGLLIRLSKPEASPAQAGGTYTSPSWGALDARLSGSQLLYLGTPWWLLQAQT